MSFDRYAITALLSTALGSFVGCTLVGHVMFIMAILPISPLFIMGVMFWGIGCLYSALLCFVCLPLTCYLMRSSKYRPVYLFGVGIIGGFLSPSFGALFEMALIRSASPLAQVWFWRCSIAGALAGLLCAWLFVPIARAEALPDEAPHPDAG